jgi:hypothetical protein
MKTPSTDLESPQTGSWRRKRLLMCDLTFGVLLTMLVGAAALLILATGRQFENFTAESNWKPETAKVICVKYRPGKSSAELEVLMKTKSGKLVDSISASMEKDEAGKEKRRLESTGQVVVFRSTFEPTEYQLSYFSEANRRFWPLLLLEYGIPTIIGAALLAGWKNWRRVITSAAGLRGSTLASKGLAKKHLRV